MIQYSLRCEDGHVFDSWFQSASAFETLKASGHLTCAVCGTAKVEKAIMAPRVVAARKKSVPQVVPAVESPATSQPQPMATAPDAEVREKLEQMKREVEANSDYVGDRFAQEARAMHLGEAEERSIYGEANADEAKSLIEDGVPVLPLPFRPTRKTN